ncbi:DNA adenine methylase [Labrys portucalensis]|uniref:DNA adenine methylase n=1 Tax=Labrys neptuniae TaxID=376174 RepID=A0ABV6ZQR4_9HYPH
MLQAVHECLLGVTAECLSWQDFIARRDRPHILFYVDPPYLGAERYYGRGMFERADHERLAAVLKGFVAGSYCL